MPIFYFALPGLEPRAPHMLRKRSLSELRRPQSAFLFL